jgi:phosphoribosylformylglycinamidine cyclo-ligase
VLSELHPGAVHAAAHITGGGMPGNLDRVLPSGADAVVDRSAWDEPRIFGEIRRLGDVDEAEMARVFNLGIGMVLVLDAADAGDAVEVLGAAGCRAVVIGTVAEGNGRVQMKGVA